MREVRDCSGCNIAWLYKDAQVLGKEKYLNLVGEGNIVCGDGIGPVLETEDAAFIQRMNECPSKKVKGQTSNP